MLFYLRLFVVEFAVGVPMCLALMGLRNRLRNLPFWNEWRFHASLVALVLAVNVLFDAARAHGLMGWLFDPPVTASK